MLEIWENYWDKSLDTIIELVPSYHERIHRILIDSIGYEASSDIERSISVWKKVLNSFFEMLMIGAMSPRRVEYIIKYGISTHSEFQELLVEIGVHNILAGTPEYFLIHLMQYPEIIQDFSRIIQNPLVQVVLEERIAFLKENNQGSAVILLEQFTSN